ncbi:MAG: hypothetical protein ACYC03_16400 [Acidovorax defluvii]
MLRSRLTSHGAACPSQSCRCKKQGAWLRNLVDRLGFHHHILEVIVGAVFKGKNPVGRCANRERQKTGRSAQVHAVNGIGDFSSACGEIEAETAGVDQCVGEEAAIDLCAACALEGGAR